MSYIQTSKTSAQLLIPSCSISATSVSRMVKISSPLLPCARRLSATERDIIRKKRVENCETGQSIFNDPSAQWVSDAYLEGKKCRIHLCFIDNTQMKLSVQSIHQIAELNITSRSKVTQEEDLTWNWVLHLITERTNFVDEGVDHLEKI